MAKLATVVDLNHYLGADYQEADERINRLLELASGKVQKYARQSFVVQTGDVVQLWVPNGARTVYLPERPVTDVTAVSLIGTGVTALPVSAYEWTTWGEVNWIGGGWWPTAVEVTYSHGWSTIPDDIVEVVCGIVSRILDNPTQEVQEAVDAHSVSHGEGAHLTKADKEALSAYRPKTYSTLVRPSVEYRGSALGVIGNA